MKIFLVPVVFRFRAEDHCDAQDELRALLERFEHHQAPMYGRPMRGFTMKMPRLAPRKKGKK